VDCSLLVGWITKQLVTASSVTTEELRQGSLLLAAAALQRIASCHTTVVHLSNSLLQYLEDKAVPLPTTKQQQQQQLSASNGINRSCSSSSSSSSTRDVAAVLAQQLLHQLVLLAPASLVALDGLPALCRLLLGPAAAHSVLFSSSSSSSFRLNSRPMAAEQTPPFYLTDCLSSVVSVARHMAAAVSPRWVGSRSSSINDEVHVEVHAHVCCCHNWLLFFFAAPAAVLHYC
jgi:hypothetical protein